MAAGETVRIFKLRPDGSEATSYDAVELAGPFPEDWRGFRAEWTVGTIDSGGLVFEIGDYLHEYFSPTAWFDVFSLFRPDGTLKGWYANVTWPTTFEAGPHCDHVVWQDLYVDLIGFPEGHFLILDEDELEASPLMEEDPDLVTLILAARDTMVDRFQYRDFPFHEG
ncbi:MAG: DUF402 domain-containing protein [Thermomicrobiales bacterium]|nr:DUF402 domain-containing protein [Thermomicrobiales bacterium]MCO5220585.1 DUF402 domain-containing protein [Thermomicrobiales bacterium]